MKQQIVQKIKVNYPLNISLVFVRHLKWEFKKRNHLTFKTADLQDITYTIYANPNIMKNYNLYLYVPTFIPSAKTQAIFNESI